MSAMQTWAQTLYDECRINLVIERPDGVRQDAMEVYRAAGKRGQIRMVTK